MKNWPDQVTFFAKASDGGYAKCTFKDVDHALFGWLTLLQNEEHTFQILTEKEFNSMTLTSEGTRPLSLKGHHEQVGYFTTYKRI